MTHAGFQSHAHARRFAAVFGFAVVGMSAMPASPRAQDIGFTVAPYLWITSVSANVSIGGASAQVHKSFVDLLRESETVFAFSGYGAVNYGNWSFFLDGVYSRLTADSKLGPLPTSTRSVTSLLDFGLSYRFDAFGARGSGGWAASIEPYVGGRYVNLSSRIQGGVSGPLGIPIAVDVHKSFSGVDPIFGARFTTESDQNWRFTLAGDIGGGAATDLTWSASGLLGYRFQMGGIVQTLWLGYKALGIDLKKGGSVPFHMNQVLHGPMIGSSFRF